MKNEIKKAIAISSRRAIAYIIYPASPQPQRPGFGAIKGSGEILGDVIALVIPQTSESRIRQIQG
ncbi:hypothetical protein [Scytonema sp. PCC 10023]|uniref:hypothetical protein n=1 Tax=Scytonema sp. PCC 10023 TaxID=1680591 RepID=UPI0039C717D6